MTSRDFCYWLQGYLEIAGSEAIKRNGLNGRQCEQVQAHLALVFIHEIDPSNTPTLLPVEAQAIHDGKPQIGGTDAHGNKYRVSIPLWFD